MKHIILMILLTLGVLAQEVGVPYVDKDKIGDELVVKKFYATDLKKLILYRKKGRYVIQDLTSNKEIWKVQFKSDLFECVGNSNLSQVVCKSGDVYRDGVENVDFYQIDQHKSMNILKSKHAIRQMIFSDDGKSIYVYSMGDDIIYENRRRPASSINIFDIKSGKIVKNIIALGDGMIVVKGSTLLVMDGTKYDDLVSNPIHSLFDINKGEKIRSFELRGREYCGMSNNGHSLYTIDKERKVFAINIDNGSEKYLFDVNESDCSLVELDQNQFLFQGQSGYYLYKLDYDGKNNLTNQIVMHDNFSLSLSSLQLSPNNNYFIDLKNDLWDINKGSEEIIIDIDRRTGDWIMITPNGYFDGSPDARKYLYMKIPLGESAPIDDATYQKYYSPEVITNILNQVFAKTKKPHGENQ